jgi:hypothetical protein
MSVRKAGAPFEGVLGDKFRWEERAYDEHIISFAPSDFAESCVNRPDRRVLG